MCKNNLWLILQILAITTKHTPQVLAFVLLLLNCKTFPVINNNDWLQFNAHRDMWTNYWHDLWWRACRSCSYQRDVTMIDSSAEFVFSVCLSSEGDWILMHWFWFWRWMCLPHRCLFFTSQCTENTHCFLTSMHFKLLKPWSALSQTSSSRCMTRTEEQTGLSSSRCGQ